ncbi:MAG: T9SS type A sorting domain-containing protein [Bacteroidia bacterium]|nr:T9SS type A sorting domain-containing protein [Bacteroidia bacterium]
MNKIITFTLGLLVMSQANAQQKRTDVLIMGSGSPSYKNEVYYSVENGVIDSAQVRNWDLGFSAPGNFDGRFYGITANHSNGVHIHPYRKGGIAHWSTFDTTGWKSNAELINSDTAWDKGAFNHGPELHPRYGWGVYNSSGQIDGDSLYLVGFGTYPNYTSFKKLWIQQVKSSGGVKIWKFRYSNLDGSADSSVTLDMTNYQKRNFAYYSMRNNVAINREPDNTKWDLVLGRYYGLQPGTNTYYQVTGILQNYGVTAAKASKVDTGTVDYLNYLNKFQTNISTIGSNWKLLNNATFQYYLDDSLAYFVKNIKGDIYKITFTDNFYSATGKTTINSTRVFTNTSSVNSFEKNNFISVYPNPASETVTVIMDNKNITSCEITDITGKTMITKIVNESGFIQIAMPVSTLAPGVYMIKAFADNKMYISKFIKN